MRINITNEINKRSMLATLLLNTMIEYDKGTVDSADVVKKFNMEVEEGVGCWAEVKISVNGIEMNAVSFANLIKDQLDRMIVEEAKEILSKRFGKMRDLLNHLEESIMLDFPELQQDDD